MPKKNSPLGLKTYIAFALALSSITGLLIFMAGNMLNQKKNTFRELRAAIQNTTSIRMLDTRRINKSSDAFILMNLYASLIDIDNDGKLVPGLASNYFWKNNSLHFEFKRDVRTKSGRSIGAKDVEATFKRLMLDKNNTHGDLSRLICPDWKGNKLSDSCSGLAVIGDTLVITPVRPELAKILIPLFASVDYRIIPESSINPISLDIVDFENTSGAYYVSEDSNTGAWVLNANKQNYHYTEDMPQVVRLVPYSWNDIPKLVKDDLVDIVGPDFAYMPDRLNNLFEDNGNFEVFLTEPIRVSVIQFGQKAVHDFTPSERAYIGQKMVELHRSKRMNAYASKSTSQFFQFASAGALTLQQLQEVEKIRLSGQIEDKLFNPVRDVTFMITRATQGNWGDFFEKNPRFKQIVLDKSPWSMDPDDRPGDVLVGVTDVAFDSDYTLLSYNFSQYTFGINKVEGRKWLDSFVKESNVKKSLEMINALHFESLKKVYVFPHSVAPYTTFYKKNLSLNFSKVAATYNLWQVKML